MADRSILLAIPFDWHNKGDVAIASVITASLVQSMPKTRILVFYEGQKAPDVQFLRNVRYIKYVAQPEAVPILRSSWVFLRCFIWVTLRGALGIDVNLLDNDELEALRAYAESDVVLFPCRDKLSVTYSIRGLVSDVLFSVLLAVMLRKPTMLYAAQIGPFGHDIKGQWVLRCVAFFLNKMSLITVRDPISLAVLQRMGVSGPPVHLTADPAFLLRPTSLDSARIALAQMGVDAKAKPLVGINASDLIYRYGFDAAAEGAEKRHKYVALMAELADYLVAKLGATVVLIPHVFSQGHDDRRIASEIMEKVERNDKIRMMHEEIAPEELKAIIGLLDMFVASRHHPLVHSVSQCIPTLGIDYTFKTKGVLTMLDLGEWALDIKTLSREGMLSKVEQLWNMREKVRSELVSRIGMIVERAALNAKLAADLMRSVRAAEAT